MLGLLEDWLLHADDGVLKPLDRFGWPGTCAPQQNLGWLIDCLGEHAVRLTQQLSAAEHQRRRQEGTGDE